MNRVVEVIIRAKDMASGVIQKVTQGFERNLRAITRTAKAVARDLTAFGAATVGAVIGLQKLAAQGSKVIGVKRTFAKVTGDEVAALNRLRDAAAGTISDFDLMAASNQAMALGSARTTEEFARMVEISKKLGKAQGIDAARALESLNTGIGRQSKLFLDNLGILIDVEKTNKDYAAALGKTTQQLTDAEKKEAFRNEALRQGEELVVRLGGATNVAAEASERFAVQLKNIRDRIAEIIATSPAVAEFFNTWSMILTEMAGGGSGTVQGTILSLANASMKALTDRAQEYSHALAAAADSTRTLEERQRRLKELGVTDVEAQRILDYINGRIRMLQALNAPAGDGDGGGAVSTPAIKGTEAELRSLLGRIQDTKVALAAAQLDQPFAAAGEQAEKAATKVKELTAELERLRGLAAPFGGEGALGLRFAGIPNVEGALTRLRTTERTSKANQLLPFGDNLAMSAAGGRSLLYRRRLEEGVSGFDSAADATVNALGRMADAAVSESGRMEVAITSSLQQIIANLQTKEGGLLGNTLGGGLLGIGIGLVGSLFARRNRDPVRVNIADVESRAEAKLNDRRTRPLQITNIYEGNQSVEEITKIQRDRERRDATIRAASHGGSG